jgi:steroid delta-isomerase-like uncharacterized protein
MSPKAVVEQYLIEGLGGSTVTIEEFVSDVELLRRTETLRSSFPDLSVDIVRLVEERDLVAAHFRAQGTHTGVFAGVPPTGRHCDLRCTAVFRVDEGRIAEAWVTWDTLSLMEQLGAVERVAAVSA